SRARAAGRFAPRPRISALGLAFSSQFGMDRWSMPNGTRSVLIGVGTPGHAFVAVGSGRVERIVAWRRQDGIGNLRSLGSRRRGDRGLALVLRPFVGRIRLRNVFNRLRFSTLAPQLAEGFIEQRRLADIGVHGRVGISFGLLFRFLHLLV